MSLSSAINAARSGLQVNSLRADTVATNVANASTAGYARRSVTVAERLAGGETTGVRAVGLARADNVALTRQRLILSGELAQADVAASSALALSARLGRDLGDNGLFQKISGLETALSNLAVSPDSATELVTTLDAARALADEYRELSSFAGNLRISADRDIAIEVDGLNAALKEVERLNGRIAGTAPGAPAQAALTDERGRVLSQIATALPIQTIARENGVLDVFTREGIALVVGNAQTISFSPTPLFGQESSLASGGLSGLFIGSTDVTPGGASYLAISSGSLAGLFATRDTVIPDFQAKLDALAGDLVSRFADDGIDPTKPLGADGLFVDPISAGTNVGLAGRIAINPAIDPDAGGDPTRLRDGLGSVQVGPPGNVAIVTALRDALGTIRTINAPPLSGGYSAVGLAAEFSSLLAGSEVRATQNRAAIATQFNVIAETERSEIGVDIDSQLQDLLVIEQAFAANARVIEVIDNLFNRLLEL